MLSILDAGVRPPQGYVSNNRRTLKFQISSLISWQGFSFIGQGIFIALTQFLVLFVTLYKILGTWKLKREAGIQRGNDLVSILLRQGKFQ